MVYVRTALCFIILMYLESLTLQGNGSEASLPSVARKQGEKHSDHNVPISPHFIIYWAGERFAVKQNFNASVGNTDVCLFTCLLAKK